MSTETKKKREKKVYSSFYDIAHVFSNEPGRDVRCRNGFVEDELMLAKKNKLLSLEMSLTQENTTKSDEFLEEYKRHFLDISYPKCKNFL